MKGHDTECQNKMLVHYKEFYRIDFQYKEFCSGCVTIETAGSEPELIKAITLDSVRLHAR